MGNEAPFASAARSWHNGRVFPVLVELGSVKVHAYGAMQLCALMMSVLAASVVGMKSRVPLRKVLVTWSVVFGVFVVAAFVARFPLLPGMVVGVLATLATSVIVGGPVRPIVDAVAMSALVAFGLGRVGCFLGGCCVGTPTDLPWGVRFPETTALIPEALRGETVHPTQLYLAAIFLGGVTVLASARPHLGEGRAAGLALATIAGAALATAPVRFDPTTAAGIGVWIGLLLVGIGGAVVAGRATR